VTKQCTFKFLSMSTPIHLSSIVGVGDEVACNIVLLYICLRGILQRKIRENYSFYYLRFTSITSYNKESVITYIMNERIITYIMNECIITYIMNYWIDLGGESFKVCTERGGTL